MIPAPSYQGKVRNIFDLGETLILEATDRVSAFDVVFNEEIPGKGKILTSISNHWFSLIDFIPNHILETEIEKFPEPFRNYPERFGGRSVLVKKARRVDVECIARGALLGSAWKEYSAKGTVNGEKLPSGLKQGSVLSEPIFTPTTKADDGHDMPLTKEELRNQIGQELAGRLEEVTIEVFQFAREKLNGKGIFIADTKLEFGFIDEKLHLIDEALTPDSSRFYEQETFDEAVRQGKIPPGMDKQVVRDYLETLDWNKQPPPPPLPKEVIDETLRRYKKIQEIILCVS